MTKKSVNVKIRNPELVTKFSEKKLCLFFSYCLHLYSFSPSRLKKINFQAMRLSNKYWLHHLSLLS